MFDLTTSADFFDKMVDDFDDLFNDPLSTRHAINCALSAYHMHEWVWGDWLKADKATQQKLGIEGFNEWRAWVKIKEPFFEVVESLANGSKHFGTSNANGLMTQVYRFEPGGHDYEDFIGRSLDVGFQDGNDIHWMDVSQILEHVVLFWQRFFETYRPQLLIKKPKMSMDQIGKGAIQKMEEERGDT